MAGKQTRKKVRWAPSQASPGTDPALGDFAIPTHDPPLAPRDEVIFLLHTGAEIEHALLVQYLYAAYSLKPPREVPPEHAAKVRAWKKTMLDIAREEMGHLITVQNLLRLIGGPLNLEREDYPFRSQLYPFRFRLEPLSKDSLAKYVVAEMPNISDPTDENKAIIARATNTSTMQVNHVGIIYARVLHLFSEPHSSSKYHLADEDFVGNIGTRQAHYGSWGGAAPVLVPDISNRSEAIFAITELAEQGEGMDDSLTRPSHYQRLLSIYREFPEPGEWEPSYRVPIDPNTGTSEGMDEDWNPEDDQGQITNPRSLKWAKLFNLRYRMLLAYLSHFLQTDGPLLDEGADYASRGLLNKWTFDEMRHLSQVASKLATLPRTEVTEGDPGSSDRAGAPFELPYTLNLPDREEDRWRTHAAVLDAAVHLEQSIEAAHTEDAQDVLLQSLMQSDSTALDLLRAVTSGVPAEHKSDFAKVVRLLEDGVRGFRIGVHHNFWRGCTRDQFVALSIFDNPLFATRPDGTFDAASSNLIKALRGEPPFDVPEEPGDGSYDPSHYPRMPAEHPPLPPQAIDYIYHWIESGCPDSDPPAQVAIPAEQ
ncbi:MAG: ferritin-like protein [Chloroflexota bacterium]